MQHTATSHKNVMNNPQMIAQQYAAPAQKAFVCVYMRIHTYNLHPTYLRYSYNLTTYTPTYPPHTSLRTYYCAVRLRFASDRILCSPTFIGEIVAFEFDCCIWIWLLHLNLIVAFEFDCFWSLHRKGGVLNCPTNCNAGRLYNHCLISLDLICASSWVTRM